MEHLLEIILPKILPPGYEPRRNYFLRPHQGKSDLQKSIPRKMKAFSGYHEPVILVILHDQDSNDCIELKKKLTELCKSSGSCSFLIRIVCRELESWYLGDMQAIESVYPSFKAKKYINKAKFRNPDRCNAADELTKILPKFSIKNKVKASKSIPQHFDIAGNRSVSFNHFVSGLKKLLSI
ncbi:MAG: DUF4276 family protein [bacterium]|nr:DUF4276 family protein [bacterium]